MHVTTKETDQNGVHVLTSVIEGDGAVALASENAKLEASIISVQRTASGGIQLQVAVSVTEPAPEAKKEEAAPVDPNQEVALAFLKEKGFSDDDAAKQIERFGLARVLAHRDEELNAELAQALSKE